MAKSARRAPRVQVTLPPESQRLVDEISELSGRSRSEIVGELVDVATPALTAMLEAIRIVKKHPLEAQRLLNRYALAAQAELTQAQIDFDSSLDGRTMAGKRRKASEQT